MISALDAIAQPRRQQILRLVWDAELPAGEIAAEFDLTFGAISQHLRVLHEAGLVARRREGRQIYYKARREQLGPLAEYLESMWNDRLAALKRAAEKRERRR